MSYGFRLIDSRFCGGGTADWLGGFRSDGAAFRSSSWFVEGGSWRGLRSIWASLSWKSAGRAVPDREGSDPGPARSGDLASGAGAHERGSLDGDQLRAALDRAVARPLQCRGLWALGDLRRHN